MADVMAGFMEWFYFCLNSPLLYGALVITFALLLDRAFGEVRSGFHPLVFFGRWVKVVEQCFYGVSGLASELSKQPQLWRGFFAWTVVIVLPMALLLSLYWLLPKSYQIIADIIVLYFVVGGRSLSDHAMAIAKPLLVDDIELARQKLSYIVSRETADLGEKDVVKATVESVFENSHDAVIAPLFWFVVAGLPGAILLRMVNTLDAMWGYRSERYQYFGRVAAKADDVMGFVSARVTVLLFGLLNIKAALASWRYGRHWWGTLQSPNGLPIMAAGAGALGIVLGGDAIYGGEKKQKPLLGDGDQPRAENIVQAVAFVNRSYWLFVILLMLLGVML